MSGVERGVADWFLLREDWVPKHAVVRGCSGSAASVTLALRRMADAGELERKPDPLDSRRRLYRRRAA